MVGLMASAASRSRVNGYLAGLLVGCGLTLLVLNAVDWKIALGVELMGIGWPPPGWPWR